jgi:TPP-dependent 2-oxoacid decarboxylase
MSQDSLASGHLFKIYVGSVTRPDIKEKVESAKCILSVGALKSDFNTGNFTYRIPTASTVEVGICSYLTNLLIFIRS